MVVEGDKYQILFRCVLLYPLLSEQQISLLEQFGYLDSLQIDVKGQRCLAFRNPVVHTIFGYWPNHEDE